MNEKYLTTLMIFKKVHIVNIMLLNVGLRFYGLPQMP
jgi:hypothetical protein